MSSASDEPIARLRASGSSPIVSSSGTCCDGAHNSSSRRSARPCRPTRRPRGDLRHARLRGGRRAHLELAERLDERGVGEPRRPRAPRGSCAVAQCCAIALCIDGRRRNSASFHRGGARAAPGGGGARRRGRAPRTGHRVLNARCRRAATPSTCCREPRRGRRRHVVVEAEEGDATDADDSFTYKRDAFFAGFAARRSASSLRRRRTWEGTRRARVCPRSRSASPGRGGRFDARRRARR